MRKYVFVIKDPETGKIVYVGSSEQPWETVKRHLVDSANPRMKAWAMELSKKHPDGIEILREVVCRIWEGENVSLPVATPGLVRLEWEIIDTMEVSKGKASTTVTTNKVSFYIAKYREEGHSVLNGQPGRPKKVLEPAA